MVRQSCVAQLAGSVENWRPRLLIEFVSSSAGLVHREDQLVRIAGWILLIAGALLCATLVWATIGFLLMGVGLLALLVAENNRKRASASAAERRAGGANAMAVPLRYRDRSSVAKPPMRMSSPAPSYDQAAWRRLVESDADLARVTSVLADYGQQYVDELAREYLAETDKAAAFPPSSMGSLEEPARASRRAAMRDRLMTPGRPIRLAGRTQRPVGRIDHRGCCRRRQLQLSEKLPISAPPPVEPAKQETVDALRSRRQ